jgi:cytochrome bd-type quinol oxidase subunit 2
MNGDFLDRAVSIAAVSAATGVCYLYGLRSFASYISDGQYVFGYDEVMFFAMQAMIVVSLVGSLRAYKQHRKILPPLLAIASASAVIYGINKQLDPYFMFPGMVGMLVVSLWNSFESKRSADIGN